MTEACVVIDGFDDYSSGQMAAAGWSENAGGISSSYANVAGQAMEVGSNGNPTTVFRGGVTSSYVHALFAWSTNFPTSSGPVFSVMEAGTEHLRLAYNGNGSFTVSRAGTTIGTTPTTPNLGILLQTWYHIEICARIHDTAGFYDVYINGVLQATGGGIALDTQNGGTGSCDSVRLRTTNTQHRFDDLIVFAGSGGGAGGVQAQMGMARVVTRLPTGDGATVDWTASAGADWQCVDESPHTSDTDYISSSTPDHVDTFTYPALGLTGTVLSVGPASWVRKDDGGTRSIREVVRSGGTDHPGAADIPLLTTYTLQQQMFDADPAGGAWSVAGVNSAQFGVKLTA